MISVNGHADMDGVGEDMLSSAGSADAGQCEVDDAYTPLQVSPLTGMHLPLND